MGALLVAESLDDVDLAQKADPILCPAYGDRIQIAH
jgi:hypothetical protein